MNKAFRIDAKIDLHGYSLQSAYSTFLQFIEYCHAHDLTNILVVTGKGKPSLDDHKTINYEFPHWCRNRTFDKYIKSVKQAEAKHGGNGAFYVTLSRDK